jgi:TrmH family RNA methyltransferase
MGAVFAVALARAEVSELPGTTIALVAGEGEVLWRLCHTYIDAIAKEATLMIGAERDGLPGEVVAQADHVAHIPIQTDSLNAAMAATVALYEITRRMAPE